MGSAVFNERGDILAHAFPALIDNASLTKAASLTLECTHGLQIAQSLELLDFRYADGRILVKAFPGAILYLLCAKNINLQVLTITLNLAAKRLESLIPKEMPSAEMLAAPATTKEQVVNDGILRLRVSHLADKKASSSFDSLGMIAVSQPTSQHISDYYKTPFKKLVLTNPAEGTNGTFAVMVMKDMGQQYDGTIIVGPGIEKKLKVSEGDKIEIRIG